MHFVSAHQRTDLVFLPDTKNVGAHHAQLADTDTTRAEKDQRAKSPGESRVHLDLSDGGLAHGGVPDAKPGYALLAEGAVENAIRAELLPQPDGTAKHASKGHVLPEHDLKNKKRQRNDKNAATPYRKIRPVLFVDVVISVALSSAGGMRVENVPGRGLDRKRSSSGRYFLTFSKTATFSPRTRAEKEKTAK